MSTLTEDVPAAHGAPLYGAEPSRRPRRPAAKAFLTASLSTTFKADCAASKVALEAAATASDVCAPSLLGRLYEALRRPWPRRRRPLWTLHLADEPVGGLGERARRARRRSSLDWRSLVWRRRPLRAASASSVRSRMAVSRRVSNP